MTIIWLTLLLFLQYVHPQEGEEIHIDVWRDPNDPTSEHRTYQSKDLLSIPPPVQKPDQSLRLILRQLLQDIHVDYQIDGPVQREVQIKISRHSMSVLSKYLNNHEADNPDDREAVRSALSNIFKVLEAAPDPTWHDTFLFLQPFIFTLNIFILPAAAVVVIRSIVRPRNFWILVFTTVLIISMYTGYNKKYQEAESRRFAQFQESSRDACAPEGLLSRMVEIVASPFQYRKKSNCLKYIESQTISIFHEISIIEVFSETISSGFFAFLSASAKHFNHFFRQFFDFTEDNVKLKMFQRSLRRCSIDRPNRYDILSHFNGLTFCSSSIGKIAGWLEGGEVEQKPAIQHHQTTKEVKRLEQEKKKKTAMIEYPRSEKEDVLSGSGNGKEKKKESEELMKMSEDSVDSDYTQDDDDLILLEESSDSEDREGKVREALNKTINTTSLSESSF
ncbi:CRE-OOC-3 protein [Caenorhabditis remanei]|uniref:Chloride channel CLIC-like protein 1 n=1 Tax=Caenorhabditis remanei TaxID=31234 RepID=E3LF77_CAERE|nr:CRE-OOC-3 protein [Caenorhabditis remanei]